MTEIAAYYYRDKLDYVLNYPLTFVSGRHDVSTESFDYFPEHHYREGFEALRDEFSDDTVDEWMDQVIGHEPIKASHGGLWRDSISGLVADILESSHGYETKITIKPESIPYSTDYLVEWERIDFDREEGEWKPVNELHDSGDT